MKDYNCKIFRHGAYKDDPTKQIPAHLPKVECDRLKARRIKYMVVRKPFELVNYKWYGIGARKYVIIFK